MDEKELQAIIKLLDDPNETIFDEIQKYLLQKGPEVVSFLEDAWEDSLNSLFHERIEDIIQKIQFVDTQKKVTEWINQPTQNLLAGAYLIAHYQYPKLTYDEVNQKIEKLKRDTWIVLNDSLTALEKVKVLNHIIFEIHRFTRNSANYYAPQNSYINHVLSEKRGNSLTLALIYSEIAQRLDIPIYGVNLPHNYILAYMDEKQAGQPASKNDVLFYINPYNRGAVLGRREIDVFLKQQKLQPKKLYYAPCTPIDTILRLVKNLVYSYEQMGYPEKVEHFKQIETIVSSKATQSDTE